VSKFSFSKLDSLQKILLIAGCVVSFLLMAPYSGLIPFAFKQSDPLRRTGASEFPESYPDNDIRQGQKRTLDDVYATSDDRDYPRQDSDVRESEEYEESTINLQTRKPPKREKVKNSRGTTQSRKDPPGSVQERSPKRSFSDIEALLSE
jgi:hypothetical protein